MDAEVIVEDAFENIVENTIIKDDTFVGSTFAQLAREWEGTHYFLAFVIAIASVFVIQWYDVLFAKYVIYTKAFIYMAMSRDTKIKKPKLGELPKGSAVTLTVIFVRHSESTWNEVFNKKPKIMIPIRLMLALYQEFLLLTSVQGSVFLDAPLNEEGLEQARDLDSFITSSQAKKFQDYLKNGVLLSSNLRRALTTCLIGFKSRFKKDPNTKVLLWSCLQECSRNIDTQSLTPAGRQPVPGSILERVDPLAASWYKTAVSVKEYEGNKTLNSNAGTRIMKFCDSAMRFKSSAPCVIVCGHSLWFRNFFKMMIRTDTTSDMAKAATTKKIRNGGVIMFTLTQHSDASSLTHEYSVAPSSIQELHLGFEK